MPSQHLSQLRHLEAITETLLRAIRGMIAAHESEARHRRGGLYTIASLPVAAAAISLARKWSHATSAIGGALAAGGTVALVLAPQIGSSADRPDAQIGTPPGGAAGAAPPGISAPPHARPTKRSSSPSTPPPAARPPASPPAGIPSPPIPIPDQLTHVKVPRHHGRPAIPGKPTGLPNKPHPTGPPKCRGTLMNLLGLLCDRKAR